MPQKLSGGGQGDRFMPLYLLADKNKVLLDLSSVTFSICSRKNFLATRYSCHSPRHPRPAPSNGRLRWAVGGGQGERGGLPGQMFLLVPPQLGFGPIDRWRCEPRKTRNTRKRRLPGSRVSPCSSTTVCFPMVVRFPTARAYSGTLFVVSSTTLIEMVQRSRDFAGRLFTCTA
jgi:hypothetical protein